MIDLAEAERAEHPTWAGFVLTASTIPPVVGLQMDHDALNDRLLVLLAGEEAMQRHGPKIEVDLWGHDFTAARRLILDASAAEIKEPPGKLGRRSPPEKVKSSPGACLSG